MKVCVYFQPKDKYDNFEGMRLRKSIKGALELADVPYSRNLIDKYDIIHFVSVDDESKINDAYEEGTPIVFSAMMSESDISSRLCDLKNDEPTLSSRVVRLLNKVSVVLVCDDLSKKLLIDSGVTSPIEVVPVGVNKSRFELTSELSSDIFYNFYQLPKKSKFVVSVGTYEDKDKFKALCEIARFCPDYHFYYFGRSSTNKTPKIKAAPANLKFHTLANDEIYCSMMKNASVYLSFDNRRHAPITLLEAAASKTQIVSLSPNGCNSEILEKVHAYTGDSTPEVGSIINRLLKGDLENHSAEAYKFAQQNSLLKLGNSLKNIYSQLLRGNEK